jgi:hypothetical protein
MQRHVRESWALPPIICRGTHNGGECGKVLGFGLTGKVHLKCPRCGFTGWFEMGLDSLRKIRLR